MTPPREIDEIEQRADESPERNTNNGRENNPNAAELRKPSTDQLISQEMKSLFQENGKISQATSSPMEKRHRRSADDLKEVGRLRVKAMQSERNTHQVKKV